MELGELLEKWNHVFKGTGVEKEMGTSKGMALRWRTGLYQMRQVKYRKAALEFLKQLRNDIDKAINTLENEEH